jgi:hypothetical protein
MNSLLFSISLIFSGLLISLVGISYFSHSFANAQSLGGPTVKITSPVEGQKINNIHNKSVTFTGISSDNGTSNCQVSIILNNVKPYQPTIPVGSNDYSSWNFPPNAYHANMKEGQNKVTAKISCLASPVNLTKWYSINFTGLANSIDNGAGMSNQSVQIKQDEKNGSSTNAINQTMTAIPPVSNELKEFTVSIDAGKNPLFLGDKQTFTLVVSDAATHLPISNAEIKGLVTHPSGKSKEFTVTTDANGQGSYSLKIGKKAMTGKMTLLIQVTKLGYEPKEVKSTADIKETERVIDVGNPFDGGTGFFNVPIKPKNIFN